MRPCAARNADRHVHAVLAGSPDVRWGIAIRAAATGELIAAVAEHEVLSTASVGKVLLLVEAARQLESGALAESEPLSRRDVRPVADSGLWQHLAVEALPLVDVCALVGAVSDNLATNVLLRRVGLPNVARVAVHLGLRDTALLDEVRDVRGREHPPQLSCASASELSDLFGRLHRGELVSPAVTVRVRRWLAADADLSMAASALDLDPLAHHGPDRGVGLVHKTGTDRGVRADTGLVEGPTGAYSYAFLANWPRSEDRRTAVLGAMRALGSLLADLVPPAG